MGGDRRPAFFDVEETYPALGHVTRAYPAIREECALLLARREQLPRYHEIDPGEQAISGADSDRHWYVFMLYVLGHKDEAGISLAGGAEGGTRTPTGCPTRPSNVRVCQFRHFGASEQKVCRRPVSLSITREAPRHGSASSAGFARATCLWGRFGRGRSPLRVV